VDWQGDRPSIFPLITFRTYAVGEFLAGAAHEKLFKIQRAYRNYVSPDFIEETEETAEVLVEPVAIAPTADPLC
jgi:hypothetical protein